MKRLIAVALSLSLIGSATAQAQKGKNGKEGRQEQEHEQGEGRRSRADGKFNSAQRKAVRDFFTAAHGRGNCPPGLAKKKNGCLPPGQAKKRYAVGKPIGRGIVVQELPPELIARIGRAPSGYQYGLVDGDVVKVSSGTQLIIDAVSAILTPR